VLESLSESLSLLSLAVVCPLPFMRGLYDSAKYPVWCDIEEWIDDVLGCKRNKLD